MKKHKRFSQACENNKQPILDVLKTVFFDRKHVLEIGSGTGQHAIYFSVALNHLIWQTSDRRENIEGIQAWCEEYTRSNLRFPIELDVTQKVWPTDFDAVFSANTAHIMPWTTVQIMIRKIGKHLPVGGKFVLYGPFNYEGCFTSESNRTFDQSLKASNFEQGIRDFEAVNTVALSSGMKLIADHSLPANNRILFWQKIDN